MASSSNHIALANKNQLALNVLVLDGTIHPEWVATIAFYKAIHVVEAACRKLGQRHTHSHKSRLSLVSAKTELQPIYKHFRILYVASCIARYPPSGQKTFQFRSRGVWLDSIEQLLDERPGLPLKKKP